MGSIIQTFQSGPFFDFSRISKKEEKKNKSLINSLSSIFFGKSYEKFDAEQKESKVLTKQFQKCIEQREDTGKQRMLPFSYHLKLGKAKQELRKMQQEFKGSYERTGKVASFKNLDISQNPVTQLLNPTYIPKKDFEEFVFQLDLNGKIPGRLIDFAKKFSPRRPLDKKYYLQIVNNKLKEVKNSINKGSSVESVIQNLKIELSGHGTRNKEIKKKLIEFSDELNDFPIMINIDNIPEMFSTHEIVSSLRLLMHQKSYLAQEEIDDFIKVINKIQVYKNSYIQKDDLVKILRQGGFEAETILKNNKIYLSTSDILIYNPNIKEMEKLEQRNFSDHPGFAFKLGLVGSENVREILAGNLLRKMGLSEFILPKIEAHFKFGRLGTTEEPFGIIGEWLEGAHDIPGLEWYELMELKKELKESLFVKKSALNKIEYLKKDINRLNEEIRNIKSGDINFLKIELTQLKKEKEKEKVEKILKEEVDYLEIIEETIEETEKILVEKRQECKQLGDRKSVQSHAIIDSLFCSYDSHRLQYMVRDGDVQCFDFARFLAPSQTFRRDNKTFATLRSTLLDHILCDENEPLDESLVKTILSWDIHEFEILLRQEGLIGDLSLFEDAERLLRELKNDSLRLLDGQIELEELKDLCNKYKIDHDESTVEDLKSLIKNRMQNIYTEAKSKCFVKIDPRAFEEMKERMIALREYVEKDGNPTVAGAFEKMYPLLSPFVNVLARIEAGPSEAISMGKDPRNTPIQRPLEQIIDLAKDKGLATEEEVEQMERSLEQLIKSSAESTALRVSMDLG